MKENIYDLLGIGIGPFNLSLAALLSPLNELNIKFCDNKKELQWHPELLFDDAPMQTSFLKDLVTPVDPTNACSFMNYLVENGQFYHFLNTSRNVITRYEFDEYLKWSSRKLNPVLDFNSEILEVKRENNLLKISKSDGEYFARNICIASGPVQNIPEPAKKYLGSNVFHAKSKEIQNLNLSNKRVLIVGGGQTGIEIFRNALNSKWGKCREIKLITGRENLLPLEEGPFTNEIFSPDFVSNFYELPQETKDSFTERLLLTSDGNTPSYLQELYNELYLDKFYKKEFSSYSIEPMRWLKDISKIDNSYCAMIENKLNHSLEEYKTDIIILATGFKSKLPSFLESLKNEIFFDDQGRFRISHDYKLKTKMKDNCIYAMNYSRHGHGIADPQTSLMSWRSAIIANSLLKREQYKNTQQNLSFIQYFSQRNNYE